MKLSIDKLQELYHSTPSAFDIEKDADGVVRAFSYRKYYDSKGKSHKVIKVSAYKERKKAFDILSEQDFYNQLADNVDKVEHVKVSSEKIFEYTLNGRRYKAIKPDGKKLFDFLNYQQFYKVVRQRFYTHDTKLRNGYFSGLIGTCDENIREYKRNSAKYDIYDIDINSAYPFCFHEPLPFGRFYTAEEWNLLEKKPKAYMNFYDIRLKTVANEFGVFIAPPPYAEYKDFDFLLSRECSQMVVSEHRLKLINTIYGKEVYEMQGKYYCGIKKYINMRNFAVKMYKEIQESKDNGAQRTAGAQKIAINSLVGCLGKRDESRTVSGLRLQQHSTANDIIALKWNTEHKEVLNYLPIPMTINDMTALRVFNMMTNGNGLRLCYNTDGGVVAVEKGKRIRTSKEIGGIKAKKIEKPLFYSCPTIYNRPLIYDFATDKVFNSNSIKYDADSDTFIMTETQRLNTRNGFIEHSAVIPLCVTEYKGFNFRDSEIRAKVGSTSLYRQLTGNASTSAGAFESELLKSSAYRLSQLCNPFDEIYKR